MVRTRSYAQPRARLKAPAWQLQFGLGVVLIMLSGCGRSPQYDPAPLRQAAALGDEQRWDDARPLIKAHLLKFPEDAAGHYFYGLSYLHLAEPELTIAEGELLTALALLRPEDPHIQAATGMDYATFKGSLHQKTAMVYMRAFREAIRLNIPMELTRDLLTKAMEQTELGLDSNPTSHLLKEYKDFLEETLQGIPKRTPKIVTSPDDDGSLI
jgi:hypothetical protein